MFFSRWAVLQLFIHHHAKHARESDSASCDFSSSSPTDSSHTLTHTHSARERKSSTHILPQEPKVQFDYHVAAGRAFKVHLACVHRAGRGQERQSVQISAEGKTRSPCFLLESERMFFFQAGNSSTAVSASGFVCVHWKYAVFVSLNASFRRKTPTRFCAWTDSSSTDAPVCSLNWLIQQTSGDFWEKLPQQTKSTNRTKNAEEKTVKMKWSVYRHSDVIITLFGTLSQLEAPTSLEKKANRC